MRIQSLNKRKGAQDINNSETGGIERRKYDNHHLQYNRSPGGLKEEKNLEEETSASPGTTRVVFYGLIINNSKRGNFLFSLAASHLSSHKIISIRNRLQLHHYYCCWDWNNWRKGDKERRGSSSSIQLTQVIIILWLRLVLQKQKSWNQEKERN